MADRAIPARPRLDHNDSATLSSELKEEPEVIERQESVIFQRRSGVDEEELQRLFEAAWGSRKNDFRPVFERSFTWVTAHAGGTLVGFVNVAWDGGVHFFLLDTTVHPHWQRQGIGTRLVRDTLDACRGAGEWIHVDFDPELTSFYHHAGFGPATAAIARVP
jgi:GNAT superfamily N-acetyltransferase